MIIVLQSSGKVAVNDNGTVKIADTSPLPSGCCCGTNCEWCPQCTERTSAPSKLYITFSGVGDFFCSTCAFWNDTFELTLQEDCSWLLDEIDDGCHTGNSIKVTLDCSNPSPAFVVLLNDGFLAPAAGVESADFCNNEFDVTDPFTFSGNGNLTCRWNVASIRISTSP